MNEHLTPTPPSNTGTKPYPSLETMSAIAIHVSCGHRPSLPRNCPNEIVKLIRMCWNGKASDRPTFSMISQQLQDIDELLTSSGSPRRRKSFGGHTDFYDKSHQDEEKSNKNSTTNKNENTVCIDISNKNSSSSSSNSSGSGDLSMALKDFTN